MSGAATRPAGPLIEGLVVASHGRRAVVEERGERCGCAVRRNVRVVTGDRVRWRRLAEGQGVVEQRIERTSLLYRLDSRGRPRPIAANVELVLVVIAPVPPTTSLALDAYLVAAERLGLAAHVVLNKADTVDPDDAESDSARLAIYRGAGYPVDRVSAVTGAGTAELAAALAGRTSVLVGASGVGKSSLTRRLAPGAEATIGELTRLGNLGAHTTSASVRYPLPAGGAIIDSPGVREFGLWRVPGREIADGYPEIRARAQRCRFRDCRHLAEPECAVQDAIGATGGIAPERYATYRDLLALYCEPL